jgi:hypothetical protein
LRDDVVEPAIHTGIEIVVTAWQVSDTRVEELLEQRGSMYIRLTYRK